MIDFLWGAESAHEDSIGLVVFVSTDPPALLTSGADRCVKAWRLDGRPQGLLLQGLAPHAPNPRWSFRCVFVVGVRSRAVGVSTTVMFTLWSRRVSDRDGYISVGVSSLTIDTPPFPFPSHLPRITRRFIQTN